MLERTQFVGGIIQNEDNEILLMHRRTPVLTQWEMPGSGVKIREDPEFAICRILHEKLGVYVQKARKLGQASIAACEYHWFFTEVIGMPQIIKPAEFDELDYFPLCRLRPMAPVLSPDMLAFYKQLNDDEIRLEA